MKKGIFITFEGCEGCGKTTQAKLLCGYLKNIGYAAVYLREPGGIKVSEKIRDVLLDPKNSICAEAETLLYMAARAQVVSEAIKPALQTGAVVVCDRFLDSTTAYQGFGLGVDVKSIQSIGHFATGGITPDLTILLKLPVARGLKHCRYQKDRIEKRSYAYHVRVTKGFFALAKHHPGRIQIVTVEPSLHATQEKIRKLVGALLRKRKAH